MSTQHRQEEFAVGEQARVAGRLGFADIDVRSADQQGRITVSLDASGPRAQSLIDEITIQQEGDTVRIETPRLSFVFGAVPRLRLRVTVPPGAGVELTTGSGDVALQGELTDVRVRTGSGDVRLDRGRDVELQAGSGDVQIGSAGRLLAKTSSGNLRVERIESQGRLSTGSGRIEIGSGSDVEATCGSGEIDAGTLDGGCWLRSGSGDVNVRRAGAGSLSAVSGSGSIRVAVADGVAANLDVRTSSGNVHSSLEPAGPAEPGTPVLMLQARAASGNVSLDRAV